MHTHTYILVMPPLLTTILYRGCHNYSTNILHVHIRSTHTYKHHTYINTHTHTHTYNHTHMPYIQIYNTICTYIHTYLYTHAYIHIYNITHTYNTISTHIHTYTWNTIQYIHKHTYMCRIYIHICTHIYIRYAHIQHMHTYIYFRVYPRSRDLIEELQPLRIVYAMNIHLRVVGFHVKWDFLPVETVDPFVHPLDSLLRRLSSCRCSSKLPHRFGKNLREVVSFS